MFAFNQLYCNDSCVLPLNVNLFTFIISVVKLVSKSVSGALFNKKMSVSPAKLSVFSCTAISAACGIVMVQMLSCNN